MNTVAVLGTGRMGERLARCFSAAGVGVIVGSREPERARQAAAALSGGPVAASGADYATAAAGAGVVVLAVPFKAAEEALQSLAPGWAGQLLIDITNPFGALPATTSALEVHAALLPPGTPIAAAWKTNFWTLIEPAPNSAQEYDCFYCASGAAPRDEIEALIQTTRFRPVDCGGVDSARVLDAMVPLMIDLDQRRGGNHVLGWKLVGG